MSPGTHLPHSHLCLPPCQPQLSSYCYPICNSDILTSCYICNPLLTLPVTFTCPHTHDPYLPTALVSSSNSSPGPSVLPSSPAPLFPFPATRVTSLAPYLTFPCCISHVSLATLNCLSSCPPVRGRTTSSSSKKTQRTAFWRASLRPSLSASCASALRRQHGGPCPSPSATRMPPLTTTIFELV